VLKDLLRGVNETIKHQTQDDKPKTAALSSSRRSGNDECPYVLVLLGHASRPPHFAFPSISQADLRLRRPFPSLKSSKKQKDRESITDQRAELGIAWRSQLRTTLSSNGLLTTQDWTMLVELLMSYRQGRRIPSYNSDTLLAQNPKQEFYH
jgi:hypothetical protein